MAVCNVNQLLANAACLDCASIGEQQVLKVAMLARLAKTVNPLLDTTPNALMANAGCFACLPPGVSQILRAQMLCNISNII